MKWGKKMILAIYCMGGYGREVYDTLVNSLAISPENEIIFIDDSIGLASVDLGGKIVSIYPFETKQFDLSNCYFVIASGEPFIKESLYKKLINHGYKFHNIIDKSAHISSSANIGSGVVIGAFVSVQNRVRIENNVAINTGAIIGHDALIGMHSVISSQANIGGASKIGSGAYIGMGALVKEGIKIGDNSIIGMGSVVFNDVPEGVIAIGNPARVVRLNNDKKVFK
jgi:sugar O-acyltransferase (sialic acid O-acetyltransferase NeuD family)